MQRQNCPCCGYPTLEMRSIFEICELCDWEDDGQDDRNADKVRGGPNGDYSLTEARRNFEENLIMYRDERNISSQTSEEILAKKVFISVFEQLGECEPNSQEYRMLWNEVIFCEKVLNKASE